MAACCYWQSRNNALIYVTVRGYARLARLAYVLDDIRYLGGSTLGLPTICRSRWSVGRWASS